MPVYSSWLLGVLNGTFSTDWDTDVIRVALFASSASSYVRNSSGYTYWSQISSGEITGLGYTASGQTASGLAISFNGFNPTRVKLTASYTSWANSTITARYAVLFKWTGNAATSPLICWIDLGSDKSSNNGTFELQWNSSGIIEISSVDT